MHKLFVANLPSTINEDVLRQLFEATGARVIEVAVPRDGQTGVPKGYAFVSLTADSDVQTAHNRLDGSFQGGRSIVVKPYQEQPHRKPQPVELSSFAVVVFDDAVPQTEALLRAAEAGGVIRQWMGHAGFFRWVGSMSVDMSELAETIGGEPVHEGEAVKEARARLMLSCEQVEAQNEPQVTQPEAQEPLDDGH